VAGKTGTAQWNSNKENHAWFIGFAPYEKPKFCLTILVEEGGEGSSTAVPLAREIFQYQFGK
jgi:cell division protein FtsI/penicillin-binding protein 2